MKIKQMSAKIFIVCLITILIFLSYSVINLLIKKNESSNNTITEQTTIGKPLMSHPRLFINENDLYDIKNRLTDSYNSDAWNSILYYTDRTIEDKSFSYQLLVIQSNAIKFLLDNDIESGNRAIEYYSSLFDTFKNLKNSINYDSYELANTSGSVMITGAMVYDWCYTLLSDTDKENFISLFKQLSSYLEIGYPPKISSSITGHSSGNQLLYYMLAAGIAIYDEDTEIYDYVISEINTEYIPSRLFLSNSSMHYQGSNYGYVRYQAELYASVLLNKIGYENVFGDTHNLIPYYWLYATRPDGQTLRDGDIYYKPEPTQTWTFTNMYLLSAYLSNDPFIQNKLMDELDYYKGTENYFTNVSPIMQVLYLNSNAERKDSSELPTTKIFGSPIGYMICRTGWDSGIESNSVVASFKVGEYKTNNHEHFDNGSFQIYYKGSLAIDSGIYEGVNGGYGSSHDINYNKRTIAHNCMLVYDPDEKFVAWGNEVSNDGGQLFPNSNDEPSNLSSLLNDGYHVSDILSYGVGPDKTNPSYSYMKGDLTYSYSSKVSNYTRSFLFLDNNNSNEPATIVVFDDITSSNENFKKYFLLHSIDKPTINGNTTTITRNTNDYNGKLINTTLLPSKFTIETIGGTNNEFNVFGTNYPEYLKTDSMSEAYEAGSYRIQISPEEASKSDIFVNVMQVMDSDYTSSITPSYFETNDFYGVNLFNNIVLYLKDSSFENKSFEIDLSNETINSSYNLIVLNLESDKWSYSSNSIKDKYTISKEDGVLYINNLSSPKIKIKR